MVEVAFLTFVGVLCRTTGGALPPLHDIIQSENNNLKKKEIIDKNSRRRKNSAGLWGLATF